MVDEVRWKFKYKDKFFENVLRDTPHGDFRFEQNNFPIYMSQMGERYFFPVLIYGMQKIKSPQITKRDLNKKDWIKGLDYEVSNSNYGAFGYFHHAFALLGHSGEMRVNEYGFAKRIIKIENELKTFNGDNEEIILPYSQLSKTIDKLLECSKGAFWRTSHEDFSKMIGYYVSGEFEEYYKKISSFSEKK
jgi:hypothetical protein